MAFDVVKSSLTHKGKIVEVYNDEITLPNGGKAHWELVKRGNAAAVVPVDENNMVTLVRQYRHGAKKKILEIPAGMLNPGEDPVTCAKRELEEETGLVAGSLYKLMDYYVSAGFCDEIMYIYLASDFTGGTLKPDPEEFIEIEKFHMDDAVKMTQNGEIIDSKTICGILAAKEYLSTKFYP